MLSGASNGETKSADYTPIFSTTSSFHFELVANDRCPTQTSLHSKRMCFENTTGTHRLQVRVAQSSSRKGRVWLKLWELPDPRTGMWSGLFPFLRLPVPQSIWAAITKVHLINNRNSPHTVLEPGRPVIRCQQVWCLVRSSSWFFEGIFSLCLHVAEGAKELSAVFSTRALIPLMKVHPHDPNTFQRPIS